MSDKNSYGQILRSSSIIGGAQGIKYIIGLVHTKLVAVLLGPSGVGLVGLYVSTVSLVGTFAGLGIDSSGVREVAEAHGSGDPRRVAQVIRTLRRICWLTGLLGWGLTVALSYPLSRWIFGSPERAWALAVLGGIILLTTLTNGRSAIIQGTRKIGDLARMNVASALASTIVSLGLYAWLGERGIVPVLLITAAINLGLAWWFSRRIGTVRVAQSWAATLANSKQLVGLGVAFMYGALMAALLGLIIRALILRNAGMDANGIFQACWSLSGLFAGFVIGAMASDFYPRLTAVAGDNQQVNRLVNEQIEIGVLLALPGLLGTLTFAPLLLHLFYSPEFLAGTALLPWMAVGVFAQVISFPLGFVQRAKGRTAWIFVSQTHLNLLNLGLVVLLIPRFGLVSAAWAFALTTYVHGAVVYGIARHLSGFTWTRSTARLVLLAGTMVALGFVVQQSTAGVVQLAMGTSLSLLGGAFTLRGIASRLGPNHRFVKFALRLPGGRLACGTMG